MGPMWTAFVENALVTHLVEDGIENWDVMVLYELYHFIKIEAFGMISRLIGFRVALFVKPFTYVINKRINEKHPQ